jgi:hypothetical protein
MLTDKAYDVTDTSSDTTTLAFSDGSSHSGENIDLIAQAQDKSNNLIINYLPYEYDEEALQVSQYSDSYSHMPHHNQ